MKRKLISGFCFVMVWVAFIFACGPVPDVKNSELDLIPPVFKSITTKEGGGVEICFNEEAIINKENIDIQPPLEVFSVQNLGTDFKVVLFTAAQEVGRVYQLSTTVEDVHRNSLTFTVQFYGFNPRVPVIVINEFITYGSATHPDIVELKVLAAGNMGGLVLYEGTPRSYDDFFVFPAFEAATNDFILVHFKPQGLDMEKDETLDKQISGGLDVAPEAYDFWVRAGDGLSGNNGALSLWASPGSRLLDGVLYSTRNSYADEAYKGFGTQGALQQATELAENRGWQLEMDQVRPEDAVNPEGSTSTRSLCRKTGPDTDSKADWYIVPSRQSSFGTENSAEVYSAAVKVAP